MPDYLAGQSNFIATHWRIPGIFRRRRARREEAVVCGDFGADPAQLPSFTLSHFPYRSWTESVDIRRGAAAARSPSGLSPPARADPITRPPQFDLDAVFDRVAEAVRAVTRQPAPDRGRSARGRRRLGHDGSASALPGAELIDATAILDDLRALKDPDEIAHLRLAGELTEIGISGAIDRLAPGMSETAVNSAYQLAVHEPVIADDRFAAFRQAEGLANIGIGADSPRAVEPGQTIKFDMQVDIAGYHSDIGRTVRPRADRRSARPSTPPCARRWPRLQAQVRPGVTFAELYAAGDGARCARPASPTTAAATSATALGSPSTSRSRPSLRPDEQRPLRRGYGDQPRAAVLPLRRRRVPDGADGAW